MKVAKRNLNSTWKKKKDLPIALSEASENVYQFVSLWWLVYFGVCINIQYFFDIVRHKGDFTLGGM